MSAHQEHAATASPEHVPTEITSSELASAEPASSERAPSAILCFKHPEVSPSAEIQQMVVERYARGYYTFTGCMRTEMAEPSKYCEVKCLAKSRAQNKRKKEGRPAKRAGGGGSKKGDVGSRKKRDGNGKGPGCGAAGAVLSGRVQKAA
ncbi:hypothetical protein N0V85_008367 [Neurospora sp. IMI 360204]|nr:hypothetical protein N0V85_008367 [Neurospora sp. IMI 360204]